MGVTKSVAVCSHGRLLFHLQMALVNVKSIIMRLFFVFGDDPTSFKAFVREAAQLIPIN